MSRFSNLEFEDSAERGEARDVPVQRDRDEHFYLRQATEAYQQADFDKALRLYSRILEIEPNMIEGWVGQVRMLIELGEFREARIWAEKALDVFKDNALVLSALAHAHIRMGDREKAAGFSDAAALCPAEDPYVWLVRGEVLLAQGRKGVRNADYCFVRAGAISGGNWFVRLLIARVYYYYRRFAEALEYCNQALEAAARNPYVWTVRGQCFAGMGMQRRAVQAYTQALDIDERFRPARRCLLEAERDRRFLRRVFHRLFHPFGG